MAVLRLHTNLVRRGAIVASLRLVTRAVVVAMSRGRAGPIECPPIFLVAIDGRTCIVAVTTLLCVFLRSAQLRPVHGAAGAAMVAALARPAKGDMWQVAGLAPPA